jgi:hypothetical protein
MPSSRASERDPHQPSAARQRTIGCLIRLRWPRRASAIGYASRISRRMTDRPLADRPLAVAHWAAVTPGSTGQALPSARHDAAWRRWLGKRLMLVPEILTAGDEPGGVVSRHAIGDLRARVPGREAQGAEQARRGAGMRRLLSPLLSNAMIVTIAQGVCAVQRWW